MKIFGIGLSRTGTRSLATALDILGFQAAHWHAGFREFITIKNGKPVLQLENIRSYDAGCDIPIAPFYKELDQEYANAKFILTIRNEESWLDSVRSHIDKNPWWWPFSSLKKHYKAMVLRKFVYGSMRFHKNVYLQAYRRHNQAVIDYFAHRPNDLLILNICNGEGWEQICPFVSKSIPNERFPSTNVRRKKLQNISE